MTEKQRKTGLELLREPFPPHLISKLPKPTPKQTEAVKADYKKGHRCALCGQWHHPEVVHLDYVGHAALTDRLLDVDPNWNWEPLALDKDGLPAIDSSGGMWIKLTILGITRLGYGDAQGKTGPNATKERIGDALRNAAMRFGAALDLWSKADLHSSDATVESSPEQKKPDGVTKLKEDAWEFADKIKAAQSLTEIETLIAQNGVMLTQVQEEVPLWYKDEEKKVGLFYVIKNQKDAINAEETARLDRGPFDGDPNTGEY